MDIKILSAYLPYGVNFTDLVEDLQTTLDSENFSGVLNDAIHLNSIRLHLRPLSQLTQEIEHNVEKFVPLDRLELEGVIIGSNSLGITLSLEKGYENIIQKLLEWKFDIFGLIERGEAIDINTIKQ